MQESVVEDVTAQQSAVQVGDPPSELPAPRQKTNQAPDDLALAATCGVWGLGFSFFPQYALIQIDWRWPFEFVGYILYAIAFIGALVGLGKLLDNSRLLKLAAFGIAFGVAAYIFNRWAESQAGASVALLLQFLAMILACIAFSFGVYSVREFFRPPASFSPATPGGSGSLVAGSKTKLEQAVSIAIALLTLLAAGAQVAKVWSPRLP